MNQHENPPHSIDAALKEAEQLCTRHNSRLTPLRKQVFELLWLSQEPLGAYDLIDQLTAATSKQIAPPTVYRTLEFLLDVGLIHRINALNAYVSCCSPSAKHPSHFMICTACKTAYEVDDTNLQASIEQVSVATGFHIEQQSLEVLGICQHCRQA